MGRTLTAPSLAAFLAVGALALGVADAFAALTAEDVPTFQVRARVLACDGQDPVKKRFNFYIADARATVIDGDWSPWLAFGSKQAYDTLKLYPNLYLKRYPVVTHLKLANPAATTRVEVELRLEEDGPVSRYTTDLFGPRLGLMVWRDAEKRPHVAPMSVYNERYWEVLKTISIPEADRPKLFPIIDRFVGGGDDEKEWTDGLSNLARAGFNALMVPADVKHRELLLKAGLRNTAGAIYNPPGYAFEFTAKPGTVSEGWTGKPGATTPEAIEKWAHERIDPFLKAGFKPEEIAAYALSDEPGWYFPLWFRALPESSTGMQRFQDYLRAQGLAPADLGAADWEAVRPIGRSRAVDLPSRRLFYWTVRFFAADSARHFANVTRAMEKASRPGLPVFTNWNNFSGRAYCPGAGGNNPDKTSPDVAMGGHDWLEYGRLRGTTMMWTEDWFSDANAWQWSFYCAKLRCAAEKGGVQFGGYVIPRTAGDRPDGVLQKILTIIGSGGKGLKYFIFGPEYTFPGNCYSENLRVLPKMAEAHAMIGKAEELLWPGARPRPQVALLAPRSACMWDERDAPPPGRIRDATNNSLNRHTVDYMAEVFDLYVALQHAGIPADFLEEEDLSPKGLEPYKVLYVTEPNIPAEFQKGLVEWVRRGGVVVTVTGAGAADRYDDPCAVLAEGLGIAEKPHARMIIENLGALAESGKGVGPHGPFVAVGPRGQWAAPRGEAALASFADGAPAVVERKVGLGRAVHFTWMPGLSYMKSSTGVKDRLPVGFSAPLREMILHPVRTSGVVPPVTVDRAMVEAPLLLSAGGAAVTLLNWTGEPLPQVAATIRVPFAVRSVDSVRRGKLPFNAVPGGVSLTLPLDAADILLLRP
jgi:hypothetical protein